MQPKRGLELGRPFGFPLLVHRSWLGAGALLVVHLALTSFGADSLPVAILTSVLVAAAIFASVVLHEGAHALARLFVGTKTVDSTLFVFGAVTRTTGEHGNQDSVSVLAGPIANSAVAAAALVARAATMGRVSEALFTVAMANLVLAIVNVLPGLPLDGGQLVATYLWRRGRDRSQAVRASARGGEAIGVAMLATGAWLALTSIATLQDAALGLWMVLVGGFVLSEAGRARRAARVVAAVAEGTAGNWARPFVGRVRAEMPVPEGGPYAVAEGSRLAGVLMPTKAANGRRAGDVMIPWTSDIALPAAAPISLALEQLASTEAGVLVVLDEGGVVRGVIDAESVQARLGAI
jgi:Zn-dependent protease